MTKNTKFWKLSTLALTVALMFMTIFAVRAYAAANQPNMRSALEHLESAKYYLEKAEHNKGGFRVKAIELCNQAIAAAREGVAIGDRQP